MVTAPALANDTAKCIETNQSGQSLRNEGKLREARDQFKQCALSSCPGPVQRDCSTWLREVEEILPSVAFSVQDAKGRDLSDVRVTMDGEVLLNQLTGSSVNVNPGRHVFVFSVPGMTDITEEALIVEGDKARKIKVRFGKGDAGSDESHDEGGDAVKSKRRGPNVVPPVIISGVGAVALGTGIALFVIGNDRFPESCRDESKLPVNSDGKPLCDKGTLANSAITQSNIGIGVMIGGGVLLAGGVSWLIYELASKPKAKVENARSIRPILGLTHIGLEGSF